MAILVSLPGAGYLVIPSIIAAAESASTNTLVTAVRGGLSDTDVTNLRWSEARLVNLLSKSQEDFVIRTGILKSKTNLTIDAALDLQALPSVTRELLRVIYKDKPLPVITHDQADDLYGLDWEVATGVEAKAVVYDKMNPLEVKIYPKLVAAVGEVLSTADLALTIYTTIRPNLVTLSGSPGSYVYSPLQIPSVYHSILEYFVMGMALRDDQDTQNRELGREHLAMYADLVGNAMGSVSRNNVRSAVTRKNKPSNYIRAI